MEEEFLCCFASILHRGTNCGYLSERKFRFEGKSASRFEDKRRRLNGEVSF